MEMPLEISYWTTKWSDEHEVMHLQVHKVAFSKSLMEKKHQITELLVEKLCHSCRGTPETASQDLLKLICWSMWPSTL